MSDVRKRKIDLILVSDLSRLSRNVVDFCDLQTELERHGAGFFLMKEKFDTSTPAGRMMVNVMISMAQFEREQTSERVAINCNARSLRGYLNGGRTVLGYQKHPEKTGTLVIDEKEARIVRTIFKTFIENGTRAKTIKRLQEMGISPGRSLKELKTGQPGRWTSQTLSNILNQAAYIGLREVNKTYKNQDQSSLKPWQQHKLVKASWPAIIEEADYYEAQRLLEEAHIRERERLNGAERRVFFLSHLLICGQCGRALVGHSAHGRSGNIHRYYYHSHKFDDQDCPRPRVRAGVLEEKLISHLRAGLEAAGYAKQLEKTLAQSVKTQGCDLQFEIERTNKEIQTVKDEIAGIWRLQTATQMSEVSLKLASEQLDTLAKRKSHLDDYLKTLMERERHNCSIKDQAHFVENNLRDLIKGWAKSTNTMKKRLLRRAVKEIVITDEEMKVTFWLSAEERGENLHGAVTVDKDGQGNIIPSRRLSPPSDDRNLWTDGSLNNKIGSPQPKLVEHLGQVKTYSVRWNQDPKIDIAELAVKRFIEGWPRKQLFEHFPFSPITINRWMRRLKAQNFNFDLIPPDLQKELRAATRKDLT